ncbi:hypothetical protein RCL1_001519 [Eukaryota sp. TZLM3-RCL]
MPHSNYANVESDDEYNDDITFEPSLPQVIGKFSHSLCVLPNKTLWAWGCNSQFQLGVSGVERVAHPVKVPLSPVTYAACGRAHSLAVSNNHVYAWGDNKHGACAHPKLEEVPTPTLVEGLSNIKLVACGPYHSLALTYDGRVYEWGGRFVGYEDVSTDDVAALCVPTLVEGLENVIYIASAGFASLALTSKGKVYFWQCGVIIDKETQEVTREIPQIVEGLDNICHVSAGSYHFLAARRDGKCLSWGSFNCLGELGSDVSDCLQANPIIVEGLSNVKRVAAGSGHSLALTSDGVVLSWGNNDYGQLGNSRRVGHQHPSRVVGLENVKYIACGSFASFCVSHDNHIYAWGCNSNNVLGDDTSIDSPVPVLTHFNTDGHSCSLM